MMTRGHLLVISGKDYDEQLQVFDELGRPLFDGYSDWLVTSSRGPLELRLNFGDGGIGHHFRILKAGTDALLQPASEADHPHSPIVVSWSIVERVWQLLSYDIAELNAVPEAVSRDWLEAWIAGCPVQPACGTLVERMAGILALVVAEDPDGTPSVWTLLSAAIAGDLEIGGPVVHRRTDDSVVNAFLDIDDGVAEWSTMAGEDRMLLTIGDTWFIRADCLNHRESLPQRPG